MNLKRRIWLATTKTAARSNIQEGSEGIGQPPAQRQGAQARQAPTELAHRARGFFVEVCVSQRAQGTAYRRSARPQRDRQVQPGQGRQQVGARCCVAAYQVGGQEVRDRDLTQSPRLVRAEPSTRETTSADELVEPSSNAVGIAARGYRFSCFSWRRARVPSRVTA